MTGFLLSVHVLAVILAIGPVAVAASIFPRYARLALAATSDPTSATAVRILHRITRVYAVIGVFVPVFGVATATSLGVLGDIWLTVSMVLTAAAATLLVAFVLPGQRRVIAAVGQRTVDGAPASSASPASRSVPTPGRLGMQVGLFNLLWAVVVVLMIYRPGSTTGVGS